MDKELGVTTGFFCPRKYLVFPFSPVDIFRFYAEKRYFFTLDNGNIRLEIIARKERDAWKQQKY